MRITITEAEIKTAITDYIAGQGFDLSGKNVDIDLKATRGPEGYSADIDITAESSEPARTPSRPVPAATPADAPKTQQKVSVEEKPAAEVVEEAKGDTANEDDVPAEKPKSLFGGMKKPVNEKAEAA